MTEVEEAITKGWSGVSGGLMPKSDSSEQGRSTSESMPKQSRP